MTKQMPRRSSRARKALSRAVRASCVEIERLEERRLLTVVPVTSTDDSGPGTLRDAIDQANADSAPDTIQFNISGTGVMRIDLASALPEVTTPVNIDGTTQPGYTGSGGPLIWIDGSSAGSPEGLVLSGGNSTIQGVALTGMFNGVTLSGADGDTVSHCYIGIDPTDPTSSLLFTSIYGIEVQNGNDVIEGNVIGNSFDAGIHVAGSHLSIQGNTIGMDPSGLTSVANFGDGVFVDGVGDVTITGNVLSGNFGNGVHISGGTGVSVTANLIGTDSTGLVSEELIGNQGDGVLIENGATGNEVGGNSASSRNVISGNTADGVEIRSASGNTISGNYIGIAADGGTGSLNLGNRSQGVDVNGDSTGNVIGSKNVISGNLGYGVALFASGNTVQGNYIGTGPDGVVAIGNLQDGVHIEGDANIIGSGTGSIIPWQANVIAYNGFSGVAVVSGQGNAIRGNSIHDNSQDDTDASVGIDLVETSGFDLVRGPTLNHAPGSTSGPNLFQDFPELTSVVRTGSSATLTGQLQGLPGESYDVDLYSSVAPHPSNYGEGAHYLGSVTVTIGADGSGTFSKTVGGVEASDTAFTATATDGAGNTSEFSAAMLAAVASSAPTLTVLTSSANPSVFGQGVTLTATVSTLVSGTVFSEQVEFRDGTALLASVAVGADGVATFTAPSGFSIGDHALSATYLGDGATLDGSVGELTQTVTKAGTSTTLTSAPNPSKYGQTVALTATVAAVAPGAGTPGGTIVFKEGATVLGSAPLIGGVATLNYAALSVGSHLITAEYTGDASFTGSSGLSEQVVQQAESTTTLTSSLNPSAVGQSLTLTASIGIVPPGVASPTGTITFTDGATTLGTVSIVGGVATLNVTFMSAGTHNLVATYNGDTNVASSSGSLTQTVNAAATTTTLTSSANPSDAGQLVTFSATVSAPAGAGTPTGTVTFRDGSTVLATVALSGGVASFATSTLSSGNHTITATYDGSTNYATSTASLVQTVRAPANSTLSGYVYVDKNNDGIKQASEQGIGCVTVKLVNAAGQIVGTATTVCSGAYTFTNVTPGVYTILETQPSHYVDGIESAGSLGGDASGDNNTISAIPVGSGQNGVNYNFGELPETFVDDGETATIGFWHNKNGQALIKSFNGGATATQLATWLSTTFPHIYGSGSANSLVGKNNNDVAALFGRLFGVSGQKLDAQVLGVALAVYSTTSTLGGNAAVKYGFTVDAIGTGHRLFNIKSSGAAFGVANNTNMEVLDILTACDVRAVSGVLYNGNTSLRNMANTVFDGINEQGDI